MVLILPLLFNLEFFDIDILNDGLVSFYLIIKEDPKTYDELMRPIDAMLFFQFGKRPLKLN